MTKIRKHLGQNAQALRESFICLVPYLIVTSLGSLIFQGLVLIKVYENSEIINAGVNLLKAALPSLVLTSFSYQLSKIKNIDGATSIALSLSIFLVINPLNLNGKALPMDAILSSIYAILIPIISVSILAKIFHSKFLISPRYSALDDDVRLIYRYTPAFILSFIITTLTICFVHAMLKFIVLFGSDNFTFITNNSTLFLLFRTLVSHILTFFGTHGTVIFDLLADKQHLLNLVTKNLSNHAFIDLFVIFGGVGASLSLAIAILLFAKDQHSINISKVAMPFLLFNVSEIIFFGLPVVLNIRLLAPFILVPIFNLFIALFVIDLNIFSFSNVTLPWTTPIFINAYLATNGNWIAVLFQAALLATDVLIYMLFVKNYTNTQSSSERINALKNKLKISSHIQTTRKVKFQEAQSFLVNAHFDTQKIVDLITNNELVIFYQPIIEVNQNSCNSFEALLRLRMKDGSVVGPYFLPALENAGLSTVIDLWVCQQVYSDLATWHQQGFHPTININIHPDTFVDSEAMSHIANQLVGFDIKFEVIERALMSTEKTEDNIKMLKKMQFKLAIDDFGTGYSSLESLHNSLADCIKFDKTLLDATSTEKGYVVYFHTSQMCRNLGFQLVAEGVETQAQLDTVKKVGIYYVQGWYFSPALPFEEIQSYVVSLKPPN